MLGRHNAYNVSLLLSLAVLTIHFPPLTHFTFAESQSKVTLLGLAVSVVEFVDLRWADFW